MSAQLISEREFLWKIVERDVIAFLKGGEDKDIANQGRMLILRNPAEVQAVRNCWAEARRVRAERREQEQREGA